MINQLILQNYLSLQTQCIHTMRHVWYGRNSGININFDILSTIGTYIRTINLTERGKRKVSQFTIFYPNEGKTFTVFASSVWKVLKKAIAQLNSRRKLLLLLIKNLQKS